MQALTTLPKRTYLVVPFVLAFTLSFGQKPIIVMEPNGLSADTAYFKVGDDKVATNTFEVNEVVYMHLYGIHGLALKDGKSFPGCSVKIIDKKGEVILGADELYDSAEYAAGVDRDDLDDPFFSLRIGSPMVEGESYKWELKFSDKTTKQFLKATATINVIPVKDRVGIKKKEGGLTCRNVYMKATETKKSSKVEMGESLDLMISGLKGFIVKAGKVSIGASMIVKDAKGVTIREETDLFADAAEQDAVDSETVRLTLPVGDPMMAGNNYVWICKVWDKNTNRFIEYTTILQVVAE